MAWNEPGPGRDPWTQGSGGKRGDSKPPDLGQMLQRLKARFRGAGGGASGNLIAAVASLLVAIWLLSGFYTVDAKDRGAVLHFGALKTIVDPGLHWRMPWPIERVEKIDVTQVRLARERATVITKDNNLVDVELQVQYHVGSPEDFLLGVNDPDDTLQTALASLLRESAGNLGVDALLGDGRNTLAPKVQDALQQRLNDYKTGLVVTSVGLQQVQPPEAVQAAFADAIKAREDQDRLREEARTYADARLPNARGEAAQRITEATSYRDESIARAQGDVARFEAVLEQYRKAPKVTRERLYLDAMSEIYGNTTKVLIDADKGNPVIYLPLDQLVKNAQAKAPDATPDAAGSPAPAQSPRPTPGNSGGSPGNGDANRSRDRGSR
ncbi:MAG: hflK [Nevskia sp.]|nr:hflK [Nevskia sp.]